VLTADIDASSPATELDDQDGTKVVHVGQGRTRDDRVPESLEKGVPVVAAKAAPQ
jgi:hypothetical protein